MQRLCLEWTIAPFKLAWDYLFFFVGVGFDDDFAAWHCWQAVAPCKMADYAERKMLHRCPPPCGQVKWPWSSIHLWSSKNWWASARPLRSSPGRTCAGAKSSAPRSLQRPTGLILIPNVAKMPTSIKFQASRTVHPTPDTRINHKKHI